MSDRSPRGNIGTIDRVVTVAAVLSVGLAAWMVLVQPFAGRRRYRLLIERLAHDLGPPPSLPARHRVRVGRRGAGRAAGPAGAQPGAVTLAARGASRGIVTGAAFGFVHLYQGRLGGTLTGVLGAYLGWITIAAGSLVPVMLLHALLDLRILGLPLDAVPVTPEGPTAAGTPPEAS